MTLTFLYLKYLASSVLQSHPPFSWLWLCHSLSALQDRCILMNTFSPLGCTLCHIPAAHWVRFRYYLFHPERKPASWTGGKPSEPQLPHSLDVWGTRIPVCNTGYLSKNVNTSSRTKCSHWKKFHIFPVTQTSLFTKNYSSLYIIFQVCFLLATSHSCGRSKCVKFTPLCPAQ